VGTQVIARGVAVFDHPLGRGQNQGTLAKTGQPDPIELPLDRINGRCRPMMFRVHGSRGLPTVALASPGGAVRAQRAHGGGEQPGFGRDVPPIPQRVQPAVHAVVGVAGGHVGDGVQDGPHMAGDV